MPTDPPSMEFWFEFGSTYSYPAAMRVADLAGRAGVAVQWRPFLLGPIFRAQGWDDSPFNLYPEKGRYMWRDLERVCAEHGLPWRRPSVFPRNGLLAARVACSAKREAWMPEFVRGVYRANFVDDLEISNDSVVAACLRGAGVGEPEAVLGRARDAEVKAALRADTEEAAARGVFGAPLFAVGEELFWGHDRLESALAHAGGATIRRGLPTDAPALSALAIRSKAHWGYDDAFLRASREELSIGAGEIEWFPTYVLDVGAEPVGFYSLEARSAERIELNHLFVEPARIGRGEGRLLLEHAAAHARERGYRVMIIQSDPHAEEFYKRCGARRVGASPSASIPGRELPLLELDLVPAAGAGG